MNPICTLAIGNGFRDRTGRSTGNADLVLSMVRSGSYQLGKDQIVRGSYRITPRTRIAGA